MVFFMDGSKGHMDVDRYTVNEGLLVAYAGRNFTAFPLASIKTWSVMVTPSEHGPGFVFEA